VNLGQELFVEPEHRDGYVTTDGLRGLADQALAAGDDGYQFVTAIVEVRPARPAHWWWGWWRRTRYLTGGLVGASVVVRRAPATTTASMARADWRTTDQWHAEPEAGYRVLDPDDPAMPALPAHPAEADTTTMDALGRAAVQPFLAADDALLAATPAEALPALTGARRGNGGRHVAR